MRVTEVASCLVSTNKRLSLPEPSIPSLVQIPNIWESENSYNYKQQYYLYQVKNLGQKLCLNKLFSCFRLTRFDVHYNVLT